MGNDFLVLVLDSVRNRVDSLSAIDAAAAITNFPSRYSKVAWSQASIPGAEQVVVQGGPGEYQLSYLNSWDAGPPQ